MKIQQMCSLLQRTALKTPSQKEKCKQKETTAMIKTFEMLSFPPASNSKMARKRKSPNHDMSLDRDDVTLHGKL